jgi:hypothetical protein
MLTPASSNDPLAAAVVTITWLIVLNKPIYPLYVWYFVGDGVAVSALSVLAVPFYAAVLLIARRSSLAARVAFVAVATLDTICETKLFGDAAATELFLAPAALIAALSFRADESRWTKGILAALYVVFLAAHDHLGAAIHAWTDEQLAHLRAINIFAVASLTVFVGWKFAGIPRQPAP